MTEATNQLAGARIADSRDRRSLPPLTPNAAMRWDVVSRLLPKDPGELLEIGCGRGGFAARLARRARRVVAVEPDAQCFARAIENIGGDGTVLNIMSDALPSSWTFDTVCAFEVLEHIEDDRSALDEWIERLRPGGTLLLSMPAHAHRMSEFDIMVGHYRRYDPPELRTLLQEAGLVDVEIELYGFPVGWVLEARRNLIGKKRLARSQVAEAMDERTAGSGRLFQPDRGFVGTILTIGSIFPVLLQRLFPNRGVGLVARARRPA